MRSIQRRLTAGLVAAFALVALSGVGAVFLAVRASMYAQFDAALRVKALVVIGETDQSRGKIDVDFTDRYLREFDSSVGTDFYQVWSVDGKTIRRSDSLEGRDLPRAFGTLEEPRYWNIELPGGVTGRAVGLSFRPRLNSRDERTRREAVDAIVVVASNRGGLDTMLLRIAAILAVGGIGVILATALVVPLVLRPGLRPLRRVADQAAAIDATKLSIRFPTTGLPEELRPICERLNALLGRLELSFERERQFGSDLAHELLTPLAEMRAITESALRWPDATGPEAHQQSLAILLRMETLVTRLLELAQAEDGRIVVNPVQFDLPTLLQDWWRPFAGRAEERKLAVRFSGPDPAMVCTDAALLGIVVGNLLSNAVEYTGEEGSISIVWELGKNTLIMRVANPAPQLVVGDLPQLFDRFWRKDSARTDGRHSGLGLAVARELTRVLNGTLESTLSPEGTLTMTLIVSTREG